MRMEMAATKAALCSSSKLYRYTTTKGFFRELIKELTEQHNAAINRSIQQIHFSAPLIKQVPAVTELFFSPRVLTILQYMYTHHGVMSSIGGDTCRSWGKKAKR